MATIPASKFAARVRDLDQATLVSLVATLWARSGWETDVTGQRVVVSNGSLEKRLLVLSADTAPEPSSSLLDSVDGVVTPHGDDKVTFPGRSTRVYTVADLRNRLLYGVDPAVGERIAQELLGVPLRGSRWDQPTEGFEIPLSAPTGTKLTLSLVTVAICLLVVGATLGTTLGGELFAQPTAENNTADSQPPDQQQGGEPTSGDSKSAAGERVTPDRASKAGTEESGEQRTDSQAASGQRPTPSRGPLLYIGALDNSLYALDATNGEAAWNYGEPRDGIASSPTVVDGTVYVGTGDGTVDAIDAGTGEQQWRFTEPSTAIFSSPTIAQFGSQETGPENATVYATSHDGSIYAVDASTGAQEWVFSGVDGQIVGSPVVGNQTLYVGDNAEVYAVDARAGELQWTFSPENAGVVGSPAVLSPRETPTALVYATAAGTMYALDPEDGTPEWRVDNVTTELTAIAPTVAPPMRTPAGANEVENGTVYTIGSENTIRAVDAVTGTERWAVPVPGLLTSSPTVAAGRVYAGTENGSLHAVDRRSGETEWTFHDATAGIHTVPTVAGETVYFGTDNGTVYGLDVSTGDQQFQSTVSERWIRSSPTVVADTSAGHSIDSRVLLGTHGTYVGVYEFGPLAQQYWDG